LSRSSAIVFYGISSSIVVFLGLLDFCIGGCGAWSGSFGLTLGFGNLVLSCCDTFFRDSVLERADEDQYNL